MKRSKLLEMEAEVAALEESLAEEKRKRSRCSECGRIKVDGKLEGSLSKMKADLREKRQALREARVKAGA